MEAAELESQLASFIAQVFNRMETTVEFIDRPSTPDKRWNRTDSPIVQMIFPEDIVTLRPIDAKFVATHPITDIFSRDDFVDAAVWVIKGIPEQEIHETILRYVDALVESYAGPNKHISEPPAEEPGEKPTGIKDGDTRGWR